MSRLPRLAVFIILAAWSCRDASTNPDETDRGESWFADSHGDVAPNYALVFPQDAVNTIQITLTAAQWAAIRENMTALWGFDFGEGAGGPGGLGGPGGPGGGGGGGFASVDPDYVPVTVAFNGRQWENVGFRLKGNSSLSSAWRAGTYKLPFRLNFDEFEDVVPSISDQRFYGFEELSMSSGWSDDSLIREKVAADIFRLAGVPAARTAFYRVFIDFGAGSKYAGVYTMVEVIDDTMVEDQFGEDTGNIYKPESSFRAFSSAQFEKKNNEGASWGDVQAAITALNDPIRSSDAATWRANLEAVFNVDHFLRWLAVNNAIVNWDTYGAIAHNYYLYNDPEKGLTWIPWDHNLSMSGNPGIAGETGGPGGPGGPGDPGGPGGLGGGGVGRGMSLTMNEVTNAWPLVRYLVDDPVYYERYRAFMRTFRDQVFTTERVGSLFDRYHGLIATYAVGPEGEQPGYSYLATPDAFTRALPALKEHLANRHQMLRQFLP